MQEDQTTSQDHLKKFEMIIKIILTRLKVLSAGKLILLLQPEIHLIGIKFIELEYMLEYTYKFSVVVLLSFCNSFSLINSLNIINYQHNYSEN